MSSLVLDFALQWGRANLGATAYYLRRVLPYQRALAETRKLRGAHRDRSAIVFGNGPSVRKLDPEKIRALQKTRGFHVLAINSYLFSDFAKIVIPDYYVLSDPANWSHKMSEAELAKLPEERRYAFGLYQEQNKKLWATLANWRTPLFVPVHQDQRTDYSPHYGFCDAANVFSENISDITRPQGIVTLTAYRALSIACFLGYERIYICGMDNDVFKQIVVDRENAVRAHYDYFYGPGAGYQTTSVADELHSSYLLFAVLRRYKRFHITNLDPEGLIDVFPKAHDLDIYRAS